MSSFHPGRKIACLILYANPLFLAGYAASPPAGFKGL
jgi:hypothetical protein